MRRYVAFLRGVSPMNARMPELKQCFEAAGFTNVRTVLASGNVVFDIRAAAPDSALETRVETAMQRSLTKAFPAIVRRVDFLQSLLKSDPYAAFEVAPAAKRVVSFLRTARDSKLPFPLEVEGARVLCRIDREVFAVYVPGADGPVFMRLIEKAFGKDITTRTWDTVAKCARA